MDSSTSKYSMEQKSLGSRLPEEQRHVWEHAALLYHAYEWQEAANIFARLSISIDNPQLRSSCLLNTAMIMARLGDYSIAASTLDIVIRLGTSSPVVSFLAGIVAYELQDYSKAEACFEMCLRDMKQEPIDHSDDGLRFVLSREMLLCNIRQAVNAQLSRHSLRYPIYGIPAEIIFEAPRRFEAAFATVDRPQRRRPGDIKFPSNLKRKSSLITSSKRDEEQLPTPRSRRWFYSLWSPLSPRTPRPASSSTSLDFDREPNASPSAGMESRSATPQFANSHEVLHHSWHTRPRPRHIPLGPRIRSDLTGEPAKFFKQGPLGGRIERMVPREAEGQHSDLEEREELKKFFREYAPGIEHGSVPHPWDIDQEPRSPQTSTDKYDRARNLDVRSGSTLPNSPASQRSIESLLRLYRNSIPSPPTDADSATLEILQPTVYKPSDCAATVTPSRSEEGTMPSRITYRAIYAGIART